MEKIVKIAVLFDYYGKLLSDKQYRVVEQYCNEDLSLSEIAEINGISKQGISDILNRSEKKLLEYDRKLRLKEHLEFISNNLKEINYLIDENKTNSNEDIAKIFDFIRGKNVEIMEREI